MTRPLRVVPAEPLGVLAALRDALSGSGPAVLVSDDAKGLPAEVPRRVALVVETSGSTARPKRVLLSADALLASAAASASALDGAGQWLLALPAHYIAGLNVLVRSLASQTEPVILGGGAFDPERFARAAERLDADFRFASLVPSQLARLLEFPDALPALRRFDRILVGGQSTPQTLVARAAELGISLTRTYGSSETGGGCVYDGIPIGNTAVRITDGQVELSGAVLAEGYLEDEERTAAAFIDDAGTRWYRTGDGGEYAEDKLVVTGRLDDVIISGGVKVSLGDIETIVRALPGHEDAVVVASASERWGEAPVVFTTRGVDREELRTIVRARLGAAAAPDRVIVLDAIPTLASGKPDRTELSRMAH